VVDEGDALPLVRKTELLPAGMLAPVLVVGPRETGLTAISTGFVPAATAAGDQGLSVPSAPTEYCETVLLPALAA
jgi:hypothetical protein